MAGNGDMQAHEATYANIMALLKWGALGCAIIALIVIFLIS